MKFKQLRNIDFDTVRSKESFPCSEELTDLYIDMLNREFVHSVHADIHYMIKVKEEYKSVVSDELFSQLFKTLPHEFRIEYNLKRDRVPFFNSATMFSEMCHLDRKRKELEEISPMLTIEHDIVLTAINESDKDRVEVYDYLAKSKHHNRRFNLQEDDKRCCPERKSNYEKTFYKHLNIEKLKKSCNLYFSEFNKLNRDSIRECA